MAIIVVLAAALHVTQQNTFRRGFCRYKSFAATGAVSELRDEPVTVRQGTVRRPDHRQHVPVERGRVRPSVGDRRGSGKRHDLRTTEVVRDRPEHGPRGAQVHHYHGSETRGRQHVVSRSGGGRGPKFL